MAHASDRAARCPATPRSRRSRGAALLGLVVIALAGCSGPPGASNDLMVREVTPAFLLGLDVADVSIAADGHGRVAVTWVQPGSPGKDVWIAVSRDGGETFGAPAPVNFAPSRVVSFPEGKPAVALGPGATLAVAWSEQRGDTSHAVDVLVRSSPDFGASFGTAVTVNDDVNLAPPPEFGPIRRARWLAAHNPKPFHGFVTLAFAGDGGLLATWLDDRDRGASSDSAPSTLYASASLDGGQTWSPNTAVSRRACPCCRPDLAVGAGGVVAIAYRAVTATGRDPAVAISLDSGRTFPRDTVMSFDGWRIDACPDQGPRIVSETAGSGQLIWYTGAAPAGVYAAPWRADAGPGGLRRGIANDLVDPSDARIAGFGDDLLIGVAARSADDSTARVFAIRTAERAGRLSDWTWLGADAGSGVLASAGPGRAVACWIERRGETGRLRIVQVTRPGRPERRDS